jgi:SAM-dependent methyltransferase
VAIGAREAMMVGFHATRPGATAAALVRGDVGGGSSYARLAALAAPGQRVLDLGCGDGALLDALAARGVGDAIGVDLAAGDLARARARGHRVVRGRAEALPLADGACDLVLCHLALMLMGDLDAVAAEVARVLAPGGRLAAVVGGGPTADGDDAFHRYLGLVAPRLPAAPTWQVDRRLGDEAGWAALLPGFTVAPFARWALELGGSFEEVWASLAGTSYQAAAVDQAALRAALAAAVAPLTSAAGRVPCTMVVWLGVATRLPVRR